MQSTFFVCTMNRILFDHYQFSIILKDTTVVFQIEIKTQLINIQNQFNFKFLFKIKKYNTIQNQVLKTIVLKLGFFDFFLFIILLSVLINLVG